MGSHLLGDGENGSSATAGATPEERDRETRQLRVQWGVVGACVVAVAIFVIVISTLPHPPPPAPPEIRFVALGDWGRVGEYLDTGTDANPDEGTGAAAQVTTAAGLAAFAATFRPEFVAATGDSFYETGLAGPSDPKFWATFTDIFAGPSLAVPWRAVLGNHDYGADTRLYYDGNLSALDPRWAMAGRTYVTSHAAGPPGPGRVSLDVFYIDTNVYHEHYRYGEGPTPESTCGTKPGDFFYWGGVNGCTRSATTATGRACWSLFLQSEIAALDNALAASTATWRIVVGHHPVRSAGFKGDTQELLAQVDAVLHRRGVHVYLNGHEHVMQHISRPDCCAPAGGPPGPTYAAMRGRDMHYVTSGAGSLLNPSQAWSAQALPSLRFFGAANGFVAVRASARVLSLEFYGVGKRGGDPPVLHAFEIQADGPGR